MPTGDSTLQHTLDEAQTIDRVHEHGARDDGDGAHVNTRLHTSASCLRDRRLLN